jgi:hypothetical protein
MLKKLLSVLLISVFVWVHSGMPALAFPKTTLNFSNNDDFYKQLGKEVREGKSIVIPVGGSYSAFPEELKKIIQPANPGQYRLNYWELAYRVTATTLLTAGIGAAIGGIASYATVKDPGPGATLGAFFGTGLGLAVAPLASGMASHNYKVEINWGKVKLTPTSDAG